VPACARLALDYDASLASVGYAAPRLLGAALARAIPGASHDDSALAAGASSAESSVSSLGLAVDLGCGTGLAGRLAKSHARRLIGVDLSGRMLELAAARGANQGAADTNTAGNAPAPRKPFGPHAVPTSALAALGVGLGRGAYSSSSGGLGGLGGGGGGGGGVGGLVHGVSEAAVLGPRMVRGRHYDEVALADGGDALDALEEHSVDLVLAADVRLIGAKKKMGHERAVTRVSGVLRSDSVGRSLWSPDYAPRNLCLAPRVCLACALRARPAACLPRCSASLAT